MNTPFVNHSYLIAKQLDRKSRIHWNTKWHTSSIRKTTKEYDLGELR